MIGRSVSLNLLDDRLLHLRRQIGADRRDRVAHLLRRDVQVLVEQELDHHHRVAVVRLAHDALHAGDRADLLFDRLEHLALDDVRRRAGIDDADREERRRDVGELVRLQLEQREQCRRSPCATIATTVMSGRLIAKSEMIMGRLRSVPSVRRRAAPCTGVFSEMPRAAPSRIVSPGCTPPRSRPFPSPRRECPARLPSSPPARS